MRIAVLSADIGWHVQDLVRAAATLGHEVVPVSFRRLEGAMTATDAMPAGVRAAMQTPAGGCDTLNLAEVDRVLVRTMPAGSLEQVVFRMDTLHTLQGAAIPVMNPPRALETAIDKYLSCARLCQAGLPVPRSEAFERWDAAMAGFERLGGDVVIKPIFGSEGRGITRASDPDTAYRIFRALEQVGAVIFLQEFIAHGGRDTRAFVIGDRVIAAMRRQHATDWRTNVARGSTATPVDLEPHEKELAVAAVRAVAAPIAGVDLIDGPRGTAVLEVNAVPGWRALARVTRLDIARMILQYLETL